MQDFEVTVNNLEYYKNKACNITKHKCEDCEVGCKDCTQKDLCCFDEVIRFIKIENGCY